MTLKSQSLSSGLQGRISSGFWQPPWLHFQPLSRWALYFLLTRVLLFLENATYNPTILCSCCFVCPECSSSWCSCLIPLLHSDLSLDVSSSERLILTVSTIAPPSLSPMASFWFPRGTVMWRYTFLYLFIIYTPLDGKPFENKSFILFPAISPGYRMGLANSRP